MVLLGIIAYVILLIFFISWFRKREGYYSTITVFGISGFIYYLSIPLESLIVNDILSVGTIVVFQLDSKTLELIVLMAILSLVGFGSGYHLSGFYPYENIEFKTRHLKSTVSKVHYPLSMLLIISASLIIIIAFFPRKLMNVGSYSGNVYEVYTSPIYAYTIAMLTYFISICVSYNILSLHRINKLSLMLIVFLILWGIYSSDKNPILLALLSGATYFCFPQKKEGRKIIGILVGTFVFLASVPIFSLFRGGLRGKDLIENYYFSATKIDPAGPFISIISALSSNERNYGLSYLNDLLLIVPKWLWPDRPTDPGTLFAQDILSNWQPGQGFGYSLLAEAYCNFGIAGSFLHYFFLGLLWGVVWKIIKKNFNYINTQYFSAIYLSIGFYWLILMHRAPLIGLVKNMIHLFAVLIPLYIIFNKQFIYKGKIIKLS